MALLKTNLKIVAAQLPPDFSGNTAELYRAFVERLEILSPVGTNFFVVGDVEPPTDQGPWLKNGTAWWVFSASAGGYVPADITASQATLFTVSEATPADPTTGSAQIWLRLKSNRVLGWFFWDGAEWRAEGHTPASGTTAERPSDPGDLEQYFDTDIGCLIHWERSAWRTVSGTPGDIKFVSHKQLADALTYNPGWGYLGESDQSLRGTVLGVASKDGSGSAANYPTNSGITTRLAGSYAGTETVILADLEIPQHTHLVGTMDAYHLTVNQKVRFFMEEAGDDISAPGTVVGASLHTLALGNADTTPVVEGIVSGKLVTSKQLTGTIGANTASYTAAATAHANVQPTSFLWALLKA